MVPCDMCNRTEKGEQLLLVLVCLVRGGAQPENLDEDSQLIFGLNLKRIKLIYSIHQVPSVSLHIITNFFLNGPHLLLFFPNDLFAAWSSAFYSPFPPFL